MENFIEIAMTYEPYAEPKRWTSDGGRLSWVAYGDVVVTCPEHGEVIRFLADYFEAEHPEQHRNACLWRGNHLRDAHGIEAHW